SKFLNYNSTHSSFASSRLCVQKKYLAEPQSRKEKKQIFKLQFYTFQFCVFAPLRAKKISRRDAEPQRKKANF
uniref:hypothetical protein n=1 Tax=Flavobacterium sp. TaxID=239 RepID=UPI00404A78CB